LTSIAKANGAQVVLMDRDDVRAQVDRFWTLELLRQCATIHARMGLDLDKPLMRAINAGARTVSELAATVGHPDMALVRARLAHLHIAGLAIIDFDNPDLAVSLAPGRAQ
jgi:hypothetical protein